MFREQLRAICLAIGDAGVVAAIAVLRRYIRPAGIRIRLPVKGVLVHVDVDRDRLIEPAQSAPLAVIEILLEARESEADITVQKRRADIGVERIPIFPLMLVWSIDQLVVEVEDRGIRQRVILIRAEIVEGQVRIARPINVPAGPTGVVVDRIDVVGGPDAGAILVARSQHLGAVPVQRAVGEVCTRNGPPISIVRIDLVHGVAQRRATFGSIIRIVIGPA